MSIQVVAYIASEVLGTKTFQLYNNRNNVIGETHSWEGDLQFQERQIQAGNRSDFTDIPFETGRRRGNTRYKQLFTSSIRAQRGNNMLKHILNGNYQELYDIINNNVADNFYKNSLLLIKISGLSNEVLENRMPKSKTGRTYINNLFNIEIEKENGRIKKVKSKSFVRSTENFRKRYKVFNVVENIKILPYDNYDINIPKEGNNCFYEWACKTYSKVSKKYLKKHFDTNEGVSIQSIIDFVEKYKLPCKLRNIDRVVIYKNDYKKNKNHKCINAIISQNHIYPCLTSGLDTKPEMNNKLLTEEEYNETIKNDNIVLFKRNNSVYNYDGKITNFDLENELFKNLKANFTYKSDVSVVSPLLYTNENISNSKYEYDLNKAYFNVAHNIIKSNMHYPLFTCFDLWEKATKSTPINELYYYTIKKKAMMGLKEYGFISNFRTGYMIKFLIENKLIKKSDIHYYKKPSYSIKWEYFIDKLDDTIEKIAYKKLNLKEGTKITDKHLKDIGFEKEYVFYNGILGRHKKKNDVRYYNLDESEYDLLNINIVEGQQDLWDFDNEANEYIKNTEINHIYLNNTSIYNMIVEYTNLIMLKNIVNIKNKYNIMPLKIKTDAIAYHKEVNILNIHKKYFKLVSNEKVINKQKLIYKKEDFYKCFLNSGFVYYDCKKILNDIEEETKNLNNNISFTGAPGTGKTHKIKNNYDYKEAMTLTNVCALNMSDEKITAGTIFSKFQMYNPDNWYNAMKKFYNNVSWIDEFSMINRYAYNFIILACIRYNATFILTGDLNQTGPIGEQKLSFKNRMFKKLMGKLQILKKDWRNDKKIIELRNFILNTDDNYKLYQEFKKLNSTKNWRNIKRHLVFSHKCRTYINNEIIKHNKYEYEHITNKEGEYMGLKASKGVVLQCRISKKKLGIYKNDIWEVVEHDNNGFTLLNKRTNNEAYFEMELMKYFKLGFAITTHSSQGLTIKEEFAIHEISKMIYSDKDILYTAITRGKQYNNLNLYYKDIYDDKIVYEKLPNITDDEDNIIYDKLLKSVK